MNIFKLFLYLIISLLTISNIYSQHNQQYYLPNVPSAITLHAGSPQSEWYRVILWDVNFDVIYLDHNFTQYLPPLLSSVSCEFDLADVAQEWDEASGDVLNYFMG